MISSSSFIFVFIRLFENDHIMIYPSVSAHLSVCLSVHLYTFSFLDNSLYSFHPVMLKLGRYFAKQVGQHISVWGYPQSGSLEVIAL